MIPIFILSYENYYFLECMINSINTNTLYQYKIIICDNASKNPKMLAYLDECVKNGIIVYRNKSNAWILGLNNAISNYVNEFHPTYIVVSDGDIILPPPKNNICWLTHLYQLITNNSYIGKLGLGLSLENIKDNKPLKHIYNCELFYKKTLLTPGVYSAQVDTTIAIYRNNIFIHDKLVFYPGHGSYIKPYFHTGRTVDFECIHLGWENYNKRLNYTIEYYNDKVLCFTKYCGYIDQTVLKLCSKKYYLFHKMFKCYFLLFWSILLIYYWIIYILKNKLIRLNKIYEYSKYSDKKNTH